MVGSWRSCFSKNPPRIRSVGQIAAELHRQPPRRHHTRGSRGRKWPTWRPWRVRRALFRCPHPHTRPQPTPDPNAAPGGRAGTRITPALAGCADRPLNHVAMCGCSMAHPCTKGGVVRCLGPVGSPPGLPCPSRISGESPRAQKIAQIGPCEFHHPAGCAPGLKVTGWCRALKR